MNIQEAIQKSKSLESYLSNRGFNPVAERNGRKVYHSPFRPDERTPSFYLHTDTGKWKDFGLDDSMGGDIIDFIKIMYGIKSNSEAIEKLLNEQPTPMSDFSFIGSTIRPEHTESNLTIKFVQPLQKPALIKYLESRKIPTKLAARYVQELHYTIYEGQKVPFYAVAFKNDAGGYALRNGFKTEKYKDGLKLQTKPQMITTIPGNLERVVIYEGFISFLSSLVHFKQASHRNTTIILNSTNNLKHIWDILPNFLQVHLFLDNDANGKSTTQKIQSRFTDAVNHSEILFIEYNDFNKFITRVKQP